MTDAPTAHPTGLDAYKPAAIAELIETAGVAKTQMSLLQLVTLAILAGAFIAFGGALYTIVVTGADPGFGPVRMLAGVAFSLGLILVLVGGAELFTGNALIVMAWADRRIGLAALLRNWTIVFVGNFVGALIIVLLVALAGLLEGPVATTAVHIVQTKVGLPIADLLFRGILCNALVCLAVWLTFATRDVAGKILAILWPISAFVALGFEHSVANAV